MRLTWAAVGGTTTDKRDCLERLKLSGQSCSAGVGMCARHKIRGRVELRSTCLTSRNSDGKAMATAAARCSSTIALRRLPHD